MFDDKNYQQVNIKQNTRAKNRYKFSNYIVIKHNGLLHFRKIGF